MTVRVTEPAKGSAVGVLVPAAPPSAARKVRKAPLVWVGLLAAGLWTYHVFSAVMISPDSALFIEYAQRLGAEPIQALRAYDQHPLFPALMLFLRQVCGQFWSEGAAGWILAGRLAGLAGYIGILLAAYALGTRAYDRRIGVITALLAALLPDLSHLAADVLSDTPHLALYLAGLAALATGLESERRARWLLGSAAASALAFLTRPEGGAVLVIGLVFVALRRDWRLQRRLTLGLSMLAVFAAISAPYQVATGRFVKKKPLPQLLQFGLGDEQAALDLRKPQHSDAAEPRPVAYAGLDRRGALIPINVLYECGRALRVVYAIPVLIGLAFARPRRQPGRILAAAFALHAFLLCALQSSYGYLDRRHTLVLAALAMPLAAAGLVYLAQRIRPQANFGFQLAAIIGLCVLLTGPWLLRPVNRGHEHAMRRPVGSRRTPTGRLLVGNRRLHRVALSADALRRVAMVPGTRAGMVEFLASYARPNTYLAIDTLLMTTPPRPATFMEDLHSMLGSQLDLAFSVAAAPGEAPTEIKIYEYRSVPRADGFP